jgi:type II secretory pathway component GspD/PulD (secretin)
MLRQLSTVAVFGAAFALAGCGTKHAAVLATTTAQPAATTAKAGQPVTPTATAPAALQAEARSAATGDVPDNQVFIVFHNAKAGYSLKYPEGWAQSGSGATVAIRDKNNIVRVVVQPGHLPTASAARKALASSSGATLRSAPKAVTLGGAPALALVYTTQSAASAVTGKRVTLVVDRYYLTHAGKVAVVDLGTPEGVDNVDAYRLMIESFRWRA